MESQTVVEWVEGHINWRMATFMLLAVSEKAKNCGVKQYQLCSDSEQTYREAT